MLKKTFFKGQLFVLLAVSFNATVAQTNTDSTANPILLAANVEPTTEFKIIPANVKYPAVLKNTAEEAGAYIEKFAENRRDYLIRMKAKGNKFFPKIEKTFARYGVAREFRVLIALESAFNGNAVSGAGAVGYWQFMDLTAGQYGLRYEPTQSKEEKKASEAKQAKQKDSATLVKKPIVDERKNLAKSTNAAARMFRDLRRFFPNDILLAVASYNYGIGNVQKAMAKTGKGNPTFWDVKPFLPSETKNYVMNFIALNVVYNNYDNFIKDNLQFNDIKIKLKPEEQQVD